MGIRKRSLPKAEQEHQQRVLQQAAENSELPKNANRHQPEVMPSVLRAMAVNPTIA